MDATCLLPNQARLEEHLRATEALTAHRDDVAVRKLISLLLVGTLGRRLHLGVKVQGNVAQILLHIAHDLTLGRRREGVASLCQDLHEVGGRKGRKLLGHALTDASERTAWIATYM